MLGMEMQKSLKIKNKYNFRETTLVCKSTVKTSSLILFKLFTKKNILHIKAKMRVILLSAIALLNYLNLECQNFI
jgi:hypothetical protein